jgi:hypothetical protein
MLGNPWKSMKIYENLWKSMKIYNSPGLCPGRVRSSGAKPFGFWHRLFIFTIFVLLCYFLKLLQSKPTQTTIFERFFKTRAMNTNSNNILSSNYCFLFEKCAREGGCQGASGQGHSPLISLIWVLGGVFFWSDFRNCFFWKIMQNGLPNGITNLRKSD